MENRPQVLIACSERVRHGYLPPEELTRLEQVADWAWFACEGGNIYQASGRRRGYCAVGKGIGWSRCARRLPRRAEG